jgi:DNA topoisomerase-3
MILIVAEKKSVGETIANTVGAQNRKAGYFEGNGYICTWAVGHLIGLFEPDDYDINYKRWDVDVLPIIPPKWETKVLERTKDQYKIVEGLLNRNDLEYVINAGDSGQEGELIQRHIYNKAMKKKVPVKRLWISSMTPEEIKSGMENLHDSSEYDNLFHAGLARSMSDWLIGMNCTRLYTCIFNAKPPLSTGRVQSPTLAEIVSRHLLITKFKSEDYFTLDIMAGGIKATWFKDLKYNGEHTTLKSFKSFEESLAVEDKVKGKIAIVTSFTKEQKNDTRPQLYSLTTLQQEANRIYKYSAQSTLTAAQSLYEKKLITYPRTDSKYVTEAMIPELKLLMESLSKNQTYSQIAQFILQQGLNIDKRIVDYTGTKITDHTALLPTYLISSADLSSLSQTELDILHLVVSAFILAMSKDCVYNQSSVILTVEGETFKATGRTIIKKGYKALQETLFPQRNEKSVEENQLEHASVDLKENQSFPVDNTEIKRKKTTPPQEYTEGTLLKKMENPFADVELNEDWDTKELKESLAGRGLGTPATRATIIEELIRRNYINREKNFLIPTERGIKMVQQVLPEVLKTPDMTAEWEFKLHQIARGKYSPQAFVNEVKEMLAETIDHEKQVKERVVAFDRDDEGGLGECPICKNGTVHKRQFQKDGKKCVFYSCVNNKKENGTCNFILWESDKFVASITGGVLKESWVKSLLGNSKRRFKCTGKKKDGSGTYDCYIKLDDFQDGRTKWTLEFPRKKS